MATKQFDSLFEQILTELTPVGAEYETFTGSLKSGIGTAPGGGYLIGKLSEVLGKSKEEVVDMISRQLFDKVFPEGTNPANNEDAYRASISNALIEIVKDIQSSQGVKVPGAGKAVAGYTARLISQLGDAKKEYGARVSKEELKNAVETAEEESEENGTPDEPKAPKAARYIDEAEYEILTPEEMSEAGVELSDELKTYYGRIENLADQVQKGKDLAGAISGGEDIARGGQKVAALIRAGAIKYATPENSDQDIEALEAGEEDIEDIGRREFEKAFGKAYRDARASEPSAMNIGYED
jgi:hypothetical protein